MSTANEDFTLAMKAFEMFTMAEKERALEHFSHLRYPSITARFFEAVHRTLPSPPPHGKP